MPKPIHQLLLAALVVLAACDSQDPECAQLASCCNTLPSSVQSTCKMDVASASAMQCASALATAQAQGECTTAMTADSGTHGCRSDADCSGATPACDLSTGGCVACTRDAQCASNRCTNEACCVPNTDLCVDASCGVADDGCGNSVSCGTCTRGTCDGYRCSTVGQPCTPATAETDCLAGEWCFYDTTGQRNVCASETTPSVTCGSSSDCNGFGATITPFLCDLGTCLRACLVDESCPVGDICQAPDGMTISTSNPGWCI